MKATRIKNLPRPTASESASLYQLDPPLEGHEFVVVSAVNVPSSGPETYIFGADKEGRIVDWSELDGSFRGGLDHVAALENAGYEIVRD